jgi:hypothetical protein
LETVVGVVLVTVLLGSGDGFAGEEHPPMKSSKRMSSRQDFIKK